MALRSRLGLRVLMFHCLNISSRTGLPQWVGGGLWPVPETLLSDTIHCRDFCHTADLGRLLWRGEDLSAGC